MDRRIYINGAAKNYRDAEDGSPTAFRWLAGVIAHELTGTQSDRGSRRTHHTARASNRDYHQLPASPKRVSKALRTG